MEEFRVVVEPLRDIAAAEAVWRALEPRAGASFFTSWTWIGTWLAETAVDAVLATVHAGGAPVAAGLFGVSPDGRLLLHETGDAAWDRLTIEYNDLLVARDAPADPRPAVLRALDGPAIVLGGVDARWLAAASAGGLPVRPARRPTFGIALDPDGGSVVDRLGAGTRAAVRQSLRRLGPVLAQPAPSLAAAHAGLDQLIDWHQARWRARGEPGAFGDARVRRFHHALLDRGWASGAVELFEVAGPDGPFAWLLNFCHGDVVHAYQSGLADTAAPRLKPGLVAHCLCADHHARQQRRRYDLMAGDARYKRNLGAPSGELWWITAYPSRARAFRADVARLLRRFA